MSRIYFHTPSGEAELHGSERAHLGELCADVAVGLLDLDGIRAEEKWQPLINQAHHIAQLTFQPGGWRQTFETSFRVGGMGKPLLMWRGKPITTRTLILNTVLAIGNDALKLAARLHGQCEIHAWVDGKNRAWLADMMQSGLDCGVFRRGFPFRDGPGPDAPERWSTQGWEQVMALLRSSDDEPVVTSYSVGNSFPNRRVAGWWPPEGTELRPSWVDLTEWEALGDAERDEHRHERADEMWDELDGDRQWELAMAGLRNRPGMLELTPDNWDRYHFRHGLTVFDLLAPDRDARLDAADLDPVSEDDEL
jgi:hypothetical protein